MVLGMATMRKITVTLPIEDVEAIERLKAEGHADSVSGFIQHAVRTSLEDVTGWGAMLAKALEETGGPMTPDEAAWADQILGHAAGAA